MIGQILAEQLKISWFQHTRVFLHLFKIREHTPLTDLMADHWDIPAAGSSPMVKDRLRLPGIDDAPDPFAPPLNPGVTEAMVIVDRQLGPSGAGSEQPAGIEFLEMCHVLPQIGVAVPARGLIAVCHHAKRRMIAIGPDNPFGLTIYKGIQRKPRSDHSPLIGPTATLHLQIHPSPVGSNEGCFRRTLGVKPDVIQTVGLDDTIYSAPGGSVHGRIAREREDIALQSSSEKDRVSVHMKQTVANRKLPHPKINRPRILARGRNQHGLHDIHLRIKLTPQDRMLTHRILLLPLHPSSGGDLTGHFSPIKRFSTPGSLQEQSGLHLFTCGIDHRGFNPYPLLRHLRIYLNIIHVHRVPGSELHSPDNPVPVSLSMIGNTVGIHSYVNLPYPVIHPDGEDMSAGGQQGREVVFVGCGKAVLHTGLLAVHPQTGFPVGPLEKQDNSAALPRRGNGHLFLIPGRTHII